MFVRNADDDEEEDVSNCDIARIVRCYDNGNYKLFLKFDS